MYIEIEDCLYDICFRQAQIEITGRCNMHCKHCRDSFDMKKDMGLENIEKIIKFAMKNGNENTEIVLSGGEPFLHKKFDAILDILKKNDVKKLVITTNGSISIKPFIKKLKEFNTMISVSLDSIEKEKHDEFRGVKGAFDKAIDTLKYTNENNIKNNIRTSILPKDIMNIEKIAEFTYKMGIKRLSISSIIPTGRALENKDLVMTKEQKQEFLNEMKKVKELYKDKNFIITTSDPLKNLCNCDEYNTEEKNENILSMEGCTAGTTSFNVNANGDLTPCAMLNKKILNVSEVDDIEDIYKESDIIKNLLSRKLKGKCGTCKLKYKCGGCRARANNINNDYLEEDPDCWKNDMAIV